MDNMERCASLARMVDAASRGCPLGRRRLVRARGEVRAGDTAWIPGWAHHLAGDRWDDGVRPLCELVEESKRDAVLPPVAVRTVTRRPHPRQQRRGVPRNSRRPDQATGW